MSLGDDGYGSGHNDYGDDRHHGTRTRLPEGEVDPYAPTRRGSGRSGRAGRPSGRNLITVVGVVVLLIAAIAFANRGDGSGSSSDDDVSPRTPAGTRATAPTGTKPVDGKTGGIASGFAHSEQGAQSAAANFAVALGGDGMFKTDSRHAIVDAIYTPNAANKLKGPQDQAYSADFLKRLGLDAAGNPPKDKTFISRTIPVGTKVEAFNADSAKVAVWYTGLIGMAGTGSTDPVRTDWKTWTFELKWVGSDWKIENDSQTDGPAPVAGDIPASGSDDITKAVKEYGGFTYAR